MCLCLSISQIRYCDDVAVTHLIINFGQLMLLLPLLLLPLKLSIGGAVVHYSKQIASIGFVGLFY